MSTLCFERLALDSGPEHIFGKSTNAARYDYIHTSNTLSDSHNLSSVWDLNTGRFYAMFSYPMAYLRYNEYSGPCHDNTRASGAKIVYHAYQSPVDSDGRTTVDHAYVVESYMSDGTSPNLVDGQTGTGMFMGDHY